MNRYLRQFFLTFEPSVVTPFARVTFAAAGAPTIDSVNSKGVKSITRTGAGQYVVVFGTLGQPVSVVDTYNRYLWCGHRFLGAAAAAAPHMQVTSQNVVGTGSIVLQFYAPDGTTATDPQNGGEVELIFNLKNSTAP